MQCDEAIYVERRRDNSSDGKRLFVNVDDKILLMKALKWITVGLLIFILLCPKLFPDSEVEQKPTVQPVDINYDFSRCPIEITGIISEYGDTYLLNLKFKNLSEYTISAIRGCVFESCKYTKSTSKFRRTLLAGETRFEHATGGFGDRCSTVEPLPYN